MSIAVAIALYNGEKFIEKQLDSIRNQTLSPDKVILCDDGSKDNTVSIVKKYIDKNHLNNKWTILENENNIGYIKNFYKAISLCEEEIVFLCDQDDIWEHDKINKMNRIMEKNNNIDLLSCRYGIIDNDDKKISTILTKGEDEDYSLNKVNVLDIMKSYRWPGMVMCIRNNFFKDIVKSICEYEIPHDLAFGIYAADRDSFYEFNYIGAYHRRHDNNVAREEHRIFKLLNLNRKLYDINIMLNTLKCILDANLSLSDETIDLIKYKYEYLIEREKDLKNHDIQGIYKLYKSDNFQMFRKSSFLCDIWLVLFGKL